MTPDINRARRHKFMNWVSAIVEAHVELTSRQPNALDPAIKLPTNIFSLDYKYSIVWGRFYTCRINTTFSKPIFCD